LVLSAMGFDDADDVRQSGKEVDRLIAILGDDASHLSLIAKLGEIGEDILMCKLIYFNPLLEDSN
jgi:hypothetical protein